MQKSLILILNNGVWYEKVGISGFWSWSVRLFDDLDRWCYLISKVLFLKDQGGIFNIEGLFC